jgi:hypothetical protein
MQHPDEGTIHAWLDGELPAEESASLEKHVAECAACTAAVAEARGFIAASSRIVSSLDNVPGNVIPMARPHRRAWYASTQFRAAAAVLVVAGASLLVFQNGNQPKMTRVMSDAASSQAATAGAAERSSAEPPKAETGTEMMNAPVTPPSPAMPSEQALRKERALLGTARGEVRADAVQQQAPPPPAQKIAPSAPAIQQQSRVLNEAVVTGVATREEADIAAGLREIRSDTTTAGITTVYELAGGVRVTLREVLPEERNKTLAARRAEVVPAAKSTQAAVGVAAAPAVPSPSPSAAATDSITWRNASSGRTYILKGPLTKEQLADLRRRLPSAKR